MKYLIIFIALIALTGGVVYYYYINNPYTQHKPVTENGKIAYMKIHSPAFENNNPIPSKYTCDGENINPPLTIEDIPYGTKSLAIIMDDPDSPTKDFAHWIVFNINPNTSSIPERLKAENVSFGKNSFGNNAYGGPCPNIGTHKYRFQLFALNTILILQQGATKQDILNNINGSIIEKSELFGTYVKK